jgi:hypothetical protein
LSDRTLALTSPHMTGEDVTGLQRDLNTGLTRGTSRSSSTSTVTTAPTPATPPRRAVRPRGVDPGAEDGVSPTDRLKIRYGYPRLTRRRSNVTTTVTTGAPARPPLRRRRREDRAGVRRDHIGVTEHPAGSNRGPDVDAWERACGVIAAPWCGCFANACLVAGGFPNQFWLTVLPGDRGEGEGREGGWEWHTTDPNEGDLVLYGSSSIAQHVGIVEKISGGRDTVDPGGQHQQRPRGARRRTAASSRAGTGTRTVRWAGSRSAATPAPRRPHPTGH